MKYRKSSLAAAVATLIIAGTGAVSTAHGAGYAVFTQGASALGQGNAVTAHADGPNTIFYNPALMNKLEGTQVEAGTTAIYAIRDFDGATHSSNDTVFFPSTFYATHRFNNSLSAGLGVFNPFGLGTEWKSDWEGRYQATKSKLTTYNVNPAVSYRIIPGLSVAAGLDVIFLDAKLEKKVAAGSFGAYGPANETNNKFTGDGTGIGFNVAAAYDISKKLTLGMSYRSEVQVDVKGRSSSSPTFSIGTSTPLDSKGKTSVRLPAQFTAGLAYKVTDPLVVEAGLRWEEWSSFRQLKIELDNGQTASTPRHWHDTLGMNVGGKYRVNDTVSVSAGYIYGSNAVPDDTFDPSIPDSDTHIFCIGTGLNYSPVKIDLSYAYQYYTDRTKNNSVGSEIAAANGTYKSDAHLFAVSLGYTF